MYNTLTVINLQKIFRRIYGRTRTENRFSLEVRSVCELCTEHWQLCFHNDLLYVVLRLTGKMTSQWFTLLRSHVKMLAKNDIHLIKFLPIRLIFSVTGVWDKNFTSQSMFEIENHWKKAVTEQTSVSSTDKKKFYVLSMFPYPSGKLHMGHARVYTISDVMARFYRMNNMHVIHPMGWDAFGLPAENAAIEKGELPRSWTYSNIHSMREQLQDFACSFDWGREFATCDPKYYKWTQLLFLMLFKCNLAYQKLAIVNWDPVDQTVLADEQVDNEGRSWRSQAKVERKPLRQWFIKTTAYSQSLLDGLDELKDWQDIVKLQKHWIGKCNGCNIDFQIELNGEALIDKLTVHTREPEALFGVSHIYIQSTHILNQPEHQCQPIEGEDHVRLKTNAVNPLNNKKIPIIVSDSVSYESFCESKLGIPCLTSKDMEFSMKNDIRFISNIIGADDNGNVVLVNSGEFTGMDLPAARGAIMRKLQDVNSGGYSTSSKLRDWLISRQRYWGTPIPIIHCPTCKAVPVPEHDLPVKLPSITKFSTKGTSVLAEIQEWINVMCPNCGGEAKRETDTMDTFVDSSWYYLRYLDPDNMSHLCSKEKSWWGMPVDLYIGGKEHAVMHLYYARFMNHFLHDQGMVQQREPFTKLLPQGMVMGQTYSLKDTGRYLKKEEVNFLDDKNLVEKATSAPVEVRWEKMSKSKHNGVDPEDVLQEYGVDTTRLIILADVPPKSHRNWSPHTFVGVVNWQHRLWHLVTTFREEKMKGNHSCMLGAEDIGIEQANAFDSRNFYLKGVTWNYKHTFNLALVISKLQGLTGDLKKSHPEAVRCGLEYERALCTLVIMLAPMAPHFAMELWTGLTSAPYKQSEFNWNIPLLKQPWPEVDMSYCLELVVKLNGKKQGVVKVPRRELDILSKSDALEISLKQECLQNLSQEHIKDVFYTLYPEYSAEINILHRCKVKPERLSNHI